MVFQRELTAVILLICSVPVAAGGFQKCVDAAGNVTYTDQACPYNAEASVIKPVVAKAGSRPATVAKTSGRQLSDDAHTQKIQGLIDASRAACQAGLVQHVRSAHPDLRDEEIKLGNVSEKFIRGGSVRISFMGHAKYQTERYHVDRDIKCEASQRDGGEWQVQYIDQPYNLAIQFQAAGK